MKKQINFTILLTIVFLSGLISCKKDDPKPTALTLADLGGDWKITAAFGTEWKKGAGIVTPKAADPDGVGLIVLIDPDKKIFAITEAAGTVIFDGSIDLVADRVTLTSGADALEFTLKDKTATGMQWDQREPNKDSDYSEQSPTNFLYFQKFWTLVKK
jgi:hypothetical protein